MGGQWQEGQFSAVEMSFHRESRSDMDSAGLRIGCCGLPLSLSRYVRIFRVVEVQRTFYEPPLAWTLEKWLAQAPL